MTTTRRVPDVLYLHGFASSPGSAKARAFAERLEPLGARVAIPRLDDGDFSRLTLTRALAAAGCAAPPGRPYAVVGSSMGGYLGLTHALRHPVAAVVAMAPALDFPVSWPRWMSATEMADWERTGWTLLDHHETQRKERISFDLVRDARRHGALTRAPACPVLVFHGTRDDVVPCGLSERFAADNPQVRLVLLDDDHSLMASVPRILDESTEFLRS
ncbi:MAG: alpha/beta hydrolase [Deltaproteobacteria bacterium]|nr:alpha/beta hydrolase [Deltaproteobacteria bacterium]